MHPYRQPVKQAGGQVYVVLSWLSYQLKLSTTDLVEHRDCDSWKKTELHRHSADIQFQLHLTCRTKCFVAFLLAHYNSEFKSS